MAAVAGLVRNPASTRNRGRPAPVLPADMIAVETGDHDVLAAGLARFAAEGVRLVVVDGGDGTVSDVITGLWPAFAGRPPPVAIRPHGNTNLIARRAGAVASDRALAALVAAARADRLPTGCALPVLRARDADEAGAVRRLGFIAGWGLYETGTRIGKEEVAGRGSGQVAAAVAAAILRVVRASRTGATHEGIRARLDIDGVTGDDVAQLLGLATTLPGRLVAGLSPFWDAGGPTPATAPVRWTEILAPAPRLALVAPFVAFGCRVPWMDPSAYRSGRAHDLLLMTTAGIVMDGETVLPGPSGGLRLDAGDALRVVAA